MYGKLLESILSLNHFSKELGLIPNTVLIGLKKGHEASKPCILYLLQKDRVPKRIVLESESHATNQWI